VKIYFFAKEEMREGIGVEGKGRRERCGKEGKDRGMTAELLLQLVRIHISLGVLG
jgi:hypothetical protein